jgi:hypothetical protein
VNVRVDESWNDGSFFEIDEGNMRGECRFETDACNVSVGKRKCGADQAAVVDELAVNQGDVDARQCVIDDGRPLLSIGSSCAAEDPERGPASDELTPIREPLQVSSFLMIHARSG